MKSLKPIPPEVKQRRRIRKYLKRAMIVAALIFGYFWILPKIFPSYAPQVAQTREALVSTATQAQSQMAQILGMATQVSESLTSGKDKIDQGKLESLAKQAIDDFTTRLKALPQEEAMKVKREFCADVVKETIQATESGTGE